MLSSVWREGSIGSQGGKSNLFNRITMLTTDAGVHTILCSTISDELINASGTAAATNPLIQNAFLLQNRHARRKAISLYSHIQSKANGPCYVICFLKEFTDHIGQIFRSWKYTTVMLIQPLDLLLPQNWGLDSCCWWGYLLYRGPFFPGLQPAR